MPAWFLIKLPTLGLGNLQPCIALLVVSHVFPPALPSVPCSQKPPVPRCTLAFYLFVLATVPCLMSLVTSSPFLGVPLSHVPAVIFLWCSSSLCTLLPYPPCPVPFVKKSHFPQCSFPMSLVPSFLGLDDP